MKKKIITVSTIFVVAIGTLSACGNTAQNSTEETEQVMTEPNAEEVEAAKQAEEEAAAKAAEEEAKKLKEEANDCYEAGRSFLYGLDGQTVDYAAAYENFEQALEKGKTEANFYLGALYDWYSYPEQDLEKARAYYEAAGDNPYAQISLGFLYLYGQGVEADSAKAQELVDAVIAAGNAKGYYLKASLAYNEKDYATAFDYYQKVSEGQEPLYIASAMHHMAYMYENGLGVEQDYTKAMEWYNKEAELGNSSAMNNIGWLYENGLGVEQDYAKAMEWYEKAAELGNIDGTYNIGLLYYKGEGVEQDYAKAMEWWEKAVESGDAQAANDIGMLYYRGMGVEQDYVKAMEWWEKAAELGDAHAMYNIGWLYESGLGVEQDSAKAKEWYDKAAEAGYDGN